MHLLRSLHFLAPRPADHSTKTLKCLIVIVALIASLTVGCLPARAYYWIATGSGTICQDPWACVLDSFWWFAVNQGYHGPLSCGEGYTSGGSLSLASCAPVGAHTSGIASLVCEGNEQRSSTGCQVPRGKDRYCGVGDSVDPKAGVLSEPSVDYTTQGPHPLSFTRMYWSDLYSFVPAHYSRLGSAWSTNFDAALAFVGDPTNNPSSIAARLSDGRDLVFNSNNNGTYTNTASTKETISYSGNGNWVLADQNSTNYTFNSAGQLTQIQYRDGYTQSLTWTSGLNTSVTDSYGRTLSFAYNSVGLLTQVTTSDNQTINYAYTQIYGNVSYPGVITLTPSAFALQSVAYPDSTSVSYQYGNTAFPFALTGMTDERGVQIAAWSWTSDGRVQQNTQAGNVGRYTFTYDDVDAQATVTNPLNKNAIYHYNANVLPSLLTQIEGVPSAHCLGANTTYQYDGNNNVVQMTDGEGRVTTYTREARGLPTSITRGYGTSSAATTTITWNPTWQVPNEIVEPGRTTDYAWNTSGQLTSITQTDTTSQTVPYPTNGQTRTWTYGYTGLDLTSVTGPIPGATTTYSYDANGFLQTVTNALGQVTTVNSVNGRGQPTLITDPKRLKTALTYDLRGRLTSVAVDTANNTPATTTVTYTPAGDVASITDPIGGIQDFTYDNARRLTSVSNSAGETVTYTRDAMGNATSVTVTNASSTTTYAKTQAFDELGRLIQSVGAVSTNSNYQFGYDKTDNLVSVADPRSYVFSYGFDSLNRLIQETDEQSATVTLTRNGIDAITAYQDPRSITTNYVRNGFGEIIQEASPDKGTTVYYRDQNGNVTQSADPRGSVPSISDLPVSDSQTLDAKGNVISYSRTVSSTPAFASTYAYDLAGNITSMTYPSGRVVNLSRDTLGRITNVVTYPSAGSPTGQTIASSISWVPYSGIAGLTFGNGVVQTFTRDTDNRMTGVAASAPSSATVLNRSLAWTGETLDSITDNQFPGNTPPFTYTAQSQTFTYTATHRLAGAVGYYGTFAWIYDATGNRTSETANGVTSTYAYPATSNQLTSITPSGGTARSFTYDVAGNITADSGASAPAMTYQFDAEGRLAKAFQTATPAEGATYAYDAHSRLSSRIVTHASPPTSTTTLYAYDTKNHIIAELNTSGQTLREYIWLDDMPVAVVDNVNTTPVIYYVQTDHLMRPARMTDQNTNWVWDVIFSPFGATAYINANPAVMDIRFPGQWFQLETGLAYNWHRHYDATTGRYIQPDPLLNDDGQITVRGISPEVTPQGGYDGRAIANAMGWLTPTMLMPQNYSPRVMLTDGPAAYGYAGQSPLVYSDGRGLLTGGFSPIPIQGTNVLQCSKKDDCYEICKQFMFDSNLYTGCFRRCMGQNLGGTLEDFITQMGGKLPGK
jgi:RHS repeat-associated protein